LHLVLRERLLLRLGLLMSGCRVCVRREVEHVHVILRHGALSRRWLRGRCRWSTQQIEQVVVWRWIVVTLGRWHLLLLLVWGIVVLGSVVLRSEVGYRSAAKDICERVCCGGTVVVVLRRRLLALVLSTLVSVLVLGRWEGSEWILIVGALTRKVTLVVRIHRQVREVVCSSRLCLNGWLPKRSSILIEAGGRLVFRLRRIVPVSVHWVRIRVHVLLIILLWLMLILSGSKVVSVMSLNRRVVLISSVLIIVVSRLRVVLQVGVTAVALTAT